MRALPNTQPIDEPLSPKRKAPVKAKAAAPAVVENRSRDDIAGAFSAGSAFNGNYFEGWTPIPRVLVLNAFSLSSGAAWWSLTMCLVSMMGRNRKKSTDPLPDEIQFSKPELSLLCRTSQHNINLVLAQMAERKLAIVSHLAGGRCLVRFIFEAQTIGKEKFPGWSEVAKVPHEQWAREKAEALRDEADEQDEIADTLEEQRVKAGVVQVVKKALSLKPGKRGKAVPVSVGVKSHRVDLIESDGSLDVTYTAAVHSGEFVTTVCVPKAKSVESTKGAKRTESTTSDTSSGRICPNGSKAPTNEGSENHPQVGVKHPRAAELSALFDPAIYQSCKKTLSGDSAALKKACAAVEDTPHDFIVDFLQERAQREIKPSHVASILLEIRHIWMKSGSLPTGRARSKNEERDEQVIEGLKMLDAMRRRRKS